MRPASSDSRDVSLSTYFPAAGHSLARWWLLLGIGALAGAGLFAIGVVLARLPGSEALLPGQDLFRLALVVHVDLSVLVWFLAFGAVLWSGGNKPQTPLADQMPGLASLGMLLIVCAPFFGQGAPVLSNYVPVLDRPPFLAGLLLVVIAIAVQAGAHLLAHRRAGDAVQLCLQTAAAALLLALCALLWAASHVSAELPAAAKYEVVIWGSGHILQFVYVQLVLAAWLLLSPPLPRCWSITTLRLRALVALGLIPAMLGLLLQLTTDTGSGIQRLGFTRLMQFGGMVPALPLGTLVVLACWRNRRMTATADPARRCLYTSLALFAVGGLLGAVATGGNTIVPAHYHGAIVGITLAFMGMTYKLLPVFGYPRPVTRAARWQPYVYGAGQLLHITGLTWSGALGVGRKVAGEAQQLDGGTGALAMGLAGTGGLIAIIGGILFVWVVGVSVWQRWRA